MAKSTRKSTSERRVDEHRAATTRAPSHEEISVRAYEIYLARGAAPGNDLDNWLEAERQLFGDRRRPEAYARERELGSKSQIPAETRRYQWTERRLLRH